LREPTNPSLAKPYIFSSNISFHPLERKGDLELNRSLFERKAIEKVFSFFSIFNVLFKDCLSSSPKSFYSILKRDSQSPSRHDTFVEESCNAYRQVMPLTKRTCNPRRENRLLIFHRGPTSLSRLFGGLAHKGSIVSGEGFCRFSHERHRHAFTNCWPVVRIAV